MYTLEKTILNFMLFIIVQTNAAEVCDTPNNEPGECILLKLCPALLEMIQDKTISSVEFYKKSICDFEGTDPKVCCVSDLHTHSPVHTIQHGNTFYLEKGNLNDDADAEVCNTPISKPGECILLTSCLMLLEMLKNKTSSSMEFVRSSICGFEGKDSKVCCISQLNSTNNPVEENNHKTNNRHLLPSRKYCGYQHSDDYEHNSNGTTISEFPWLARIVYRRYNESPDSYKKRYYCLGSLINVRYILTTATCVIQSYAIPMEVQLGEYHIANDTDCVTDLTNIEECSDPIISYGIEKIIPHLSYNTPIYANDIALIRLNANVVYSDYIRPICLPYPGTTFANIGNTLTSSGWGFINIKGDEAIIKKKILGLLTSNVDCAEAYKSVKTLTLTEKQLCTIPFENSTELNCAGDSGAPVIFSHKLQWHQEGIVSMGAKCGSKVPDIHTRVQKYLQWIEENIDP